jgi:hypothetical protein
VLLEALVLSLVLAVPHPRGYRERRRQVVVQDRVRNGHGGAGAVELEHLVRLVALVGDERFGPFGPDTRAWQEIYRRRGSPAQFALRLDAVGVAVAALADVSATSRMSTNERRKVCVLTSLPDRLSSSAPSRCTGRRTAPGWQKGTTPACRLWGRSRPSRAIPASRADTLG